MGTPGKVDGIIKNFNKVFSADSSMYDRTKGLLKLSGSTKLRISSPISDFNNSVIKIMDTVIGLAS